MQPIGEYSEGLVLTRGEELYVNTHTHTHSTFQHSVYRTSVVVRYHAVAASVLWYSLPSDVQSSSYTTIKTADTSNM